MVQMLKYLNTKYDWLQQWFDSLNASSSSSRSSPTLWAGATPITSQQSTYEYDGIFTSPLSKEIQNSPLTLEHKDPKFEMFSDEQDQKKYLINY